MSSYDEALEAIQDRATTAPGQQFGDAEMDRDYLLALCRRQRTEAAEAWDDGFKQGGPMHDEHYGEPDKHKINPYRKA